MSAPSRARTEDPLIKSQADPGPNVKQVNSSEADESSLASPLAPASRDPELAAVVTAWPDLSDPIRRAVLALVRAASG